MRLSVAMGCNSSKSVKQTGDAQRTTKIATARSPVSMTSPTIVSYEDDAYPSPAHWCEAPVFIPSPARPPVSVTLHPVVSYEDGGLVPKDNTPVCRCKKHRCKHANACGHTFCDDCIRRLKSCPGCDAPIAHARRVYGYAP